MMGLFLHVYVCSHMLMNCIQNILERGAEIYSSSALSITYIYIYILRERERERENRLQYDGEYSNADNLVGTPHHLNTLDFSKRVPPIQQKSTTQYNIISLTSYKHMHIENFACIQNICGKKNRGLMQICATLIACQI